MEAFAEGSFTIGGKLKVTRSYIDSGTTPSDKAKGVTCNYTYYTRVENIENPGVKPVAQVGIVHGFSENSDFYLEYAY